MSATYDINVNISSDTRGVSGVNVAAIVWRATCTVAYLRNRNRAYDMKTLLAHLAPQRIFSLATAVLVFTANLAHAGAVDPMSRDACKEALPYIAKEFAGVLEPIRRERHCLAGDFNGDGKLDVFVVVKVVTGKVPAAARIKTILPFNFGATATQEKGRLQFLVLHSTPSGAVRDWAHYDRLLLDGVSSVLVLRDEKTDSDMERITPASEEVKQLKLPKRAMHGDGVYLMTEAVQAIIYWNGKTYVFHEDPAGP
jgi:hypothetical protein